MNAITTILEPSREAEAIQVLGNSLYPGARPESIAMVLSYCRMNGLDPMLKPVHIVPTSIRLPSGKYEMRDVLMPGIADYRIKAARSGEYGGKTEPEFGPDVTDKIDNVQVTYPRWCRVTVSRIVQGEVRHFTANERWLENYATAGRDTEAPNKMWRKRPYGQLAKCAESQALRMAFPEFSGGYTAEEMEGKTGGEFAGPTIEATPEPAPTMTAKPKVSEWLDALQRELDEATAADVVDEIVARPEVQRALDKLQNGPRARLMEMIAGANARTAPPAAEVDDFPGDRP